MLKKLGITVLTLLLTGCVMAPTDESEGERQVNPHPVRYENPQSNGEYVNDHVRMLQKEKLSLNDDVGSNSSPDTTSLTEEITKEIMKNRDIIMADVHEDEDHLYIAVKLRENNFDRSHRENVLPAIEQSVKRVAGNDHKQLVIWTDHIEWNELKNEASTPEIIKRFNEFSEQDE